MTQLNFVYGAAPSYAKVKDTVKGHSEKKKKKTRLPQFIKRCVVQTRVKYFLPYLKLKPNLANNSVAVEETTRFRC